MSRDISGLFEIRKRKLKQIWKDIGNLKSKNLIKNDKKKIDPNCDFTIWFEIFNDVLKNRIFLIFIGHSLFGWRGSYLNLPLAI